MKARFLFLLSSIPLSAGVSSENWKGLPAGQSAYETIPATRPAGSRPEYRINVQDTLTISVFREPDMSVKEAPVETGGTLVLPLIGRIMAAGKTTEQFAKEIQS